MSATVIAISVEEWKCVHNFKNLLNVVNKYSISDAAKSYLKNKDRCLICTVIFFINQYETAKSKFSILWSNLVNSTQAKLCESLKKIVSWLTFFEQNWESDWIYTHLINQQIWNSNQKKRSASSRNSSYDDNNSDNDIVDVKKSKSK